MAPVVSQNVFLAGSLSKLVAFQLESTGGSEEYK